MTRIGKFWTDAVAYIALTLGSGVSIAGNVADTYRTRGAATDGLDLFLAAFWPATVVLTVELFVNKRWLNLAWPMQVLRWTGCVAIGGMAMRVSWVHLNDLMASRGQKADVAILGPLAIDALAIMATALILAGRRGHGHVATTRDHSLATLFTGGHVATTDTMATDTMATDMMATDTMATDTMATDMDSVVWDYSDPASPVATDMGAPFFRPVPPEEMDWRATTFSTDDIEGMPEPMATRPEADYAAWQNGYEDGLTEAGRELVTEAEGILKRTETDTLPQRERLSVSADVTAMIKEWAGSRADLVKHVSVVCNVSTRTARRWISAVLGPDRKGGSVDDR